MQNRHLPGLDGLRGLAAMAIVIHHLEQSRLFFGLSTYWNWYPIQRLGVLGVSFFFVLSGFLITHLLLTEQLETGKINLRKFYIRRVLRIWPLYFALTLAGFFVIPHIAALEIPGNPAAISDYGPKLAMYLALSPQVAQSIYHASPVPYSAVLWSVGVEEWFYLFWPFLLFLPRRTMVAVLPGILVGLIVCRLVFRGGPGFYFFSQIRFDCMAVGAAAAILWRYKFAMHLTLDARVWHAAWIAALGSLLLGLRFGPLDDVIYSTLFAVIIMNAAILGRGGKLLNNQASVFLGRVSYGMYCINWITLVLAIRLVNWHPAHYAVGFALTIGVAWLSYRYFEQPFLRLKRRRFEPATQDTRTLQPTAMPDIAAPPPALMATER